MSRPPKTKLKKLTAAQIRQLRGSLKLKPSFAEQRAADRRKGLELEEGKFGFAATGGVSALR